MPKKKFFKILVYDLKNGMSDNVPKYIVAFLLFVALGLSFNKIAVRGFEQQYIPSFIDYIAYIFKGMKTYVPNETAIFDIPITWFIIQTLICLLVARYPVKDLCTHGTQIIIRAEKKSKWWISKCIWIVLTVVLFYLIGFLAVLSVCLLKGGTLTGINHNLNRLANGFDFIGISNIRLVLTLLVLPVAISIALSMVQMLISFILTPIYSFMIIISLHIITAYYCTPILLGNFSMVLRNNIAVREGLNTNQGFLYSILLIIVSVIIGNIYINRMDLIKKKA